MDVDANADTNGSTIALCEHYSSELKMDIQSPDNQISTIILL